MIRLLGQAAELMGAHGWSSPQLESLLQRLKEAAHHLPAPLEDAAGPSTEALPHLRAESVSCPPAAPIQSYSPSFEAAFTSAAPELASTCHLGIPEFLPYPDLPLIFRRCTTASGHVCLCLKC